MNVKIGIEICIWNELEFWKLNLKEIGISEIRVLEIIWKLINSFLKNKK